MNLLTTKLENCIKIINDNALSRINNLVSDCISLAPNRVEQEKLKILGSSPFHKLHWLKPYLYDIASVNLEHCNMNSSDSNVADIANIFDDPGILTYILGYDTDVFMSNNTKIIKGSKVLIDSTTGAGIINKTISFDNGSSYANVTLGLLTPFTDRSVFLVYCNTVISMDVPQNLSYVSFPTPHSKYYLLTRISDGMFYMYDFSKQNHLLVDVNNSKHAVCYNVQNREFEQDEYEIQIVSFSENSNNVISNMDCTLPKLMYTYSKVYLKTAEDYVEKLQNTMPWLESIASKVIGVPVKYDENLQVIDYDDPFLPEYYENERRQKVLKELEVDTGIICGKVTLITDLKERDIGFRFSGTLKEDKNLSVEWLMWGLHRNGLKTQDTIIRSFPPVLKTRLPNTTVKASLYVQDPYATVSICDEDRHDKVLTVTEINFNFDDKLECENVSIRHKFADTSDIRSFLLSISSTVEVSVVGNKGYIVKSNLNNPSLEEEIINSIAKKINSVQVHSENKKDISCETYTL